MSHRRHNASFSCCDGKNSVTPKLIENRCLEEFHRFGSLSFKEKTAESPLTIEILLGKLWKHLYGESGQVFPENLPFSINEVPTLQYLTQIQAHVTTKVLAAVSTRPIVTIFDLENELCDELNVEKFEDLGIASHLHHLPIVQLYFKVQKFDQILPITSRDVLEYLLFDEDAVSLLQSSGDSVDVAYHYSKYYRDTQANKQNPIKVTNLGLHIQNLSSFLRCLRSEIGNHSQRVHEFTSSQSWRVSKNKLVYEKLLLCFDQFLVRANLTERNHFSVPLTTKEAENSSIPLRFFSSSDGPVGTLVLDVVVGKDYKSKDEETTFITTAPQANAAPPLYKPRKKGYTSDAEIIPPAFTEHVETPTLTKKASDDPLSFLRPKGLSSFNCNEIKDGNMSSTDVAKLRDTKEEINHNCVQSGKNSSTLSSFNSEGQPVQLFKEVNNAPGFTPESALNFLTHSVLPLCIIKENPNSKSLVHPDNPESVSLVIAALSALEVGQRVSILFLRRIFFVLEHLCRRFDDSSPQNKSSLNTLRIPVLFTGYSALPKKEDPLLIIDMATKNTICWSSPPLGPGKDKNLFSRALSLIFEDSCKPFFCEMLKVPEFANVHCWIALVKSCKPHVSLDGNTETALLDIMCACIEEDFRVRLTEGGGGSDAKNTVAAIVASLPEDVSTLRMFPLQRRWRCGNEELYYGGSTYFGLSGTYLKEKGGLNGELLILPFTGKGPHFAVEAVLECAGICSLDKMITGNFLFNGCELRTEVAAVYNRLKLLLPYIEVYLSTKHSLLFSLSIDVLRARLRTLSMCSGSSMSFRRKLHTATGRVFVMTTPLNMNYIEQFNTLYCEEVTEFTNRVFAKAVCDLFLPFAPSSGEVQQFLDFLERLFAVCSSVEMSVFAESISNSEINDLCAALDAVAASWGCNINNFKSSGANSAVSGCLFLASQPSFRYRNFFPNGSNGLATPSWGTKNNTVLDGKRVSGIRSLGFERSGGEPFIFSLTQWTDSFFSEPLKRLQELESQVSAAEHGIHAKDVHPAQESIEHKEKNTNMNFPQDEGFISMKNNSRKRGRIDESLVASDPYSRIAERYVYNIIKEQCNGDRNLQVLWMNEDTEKGSPYDILVVRNNSRGGKEVFSLIEVKSTSTSNRKDFELSIAELIMAARYGVNYKIYRVFNAETIESRTKQKLIVYEDLLKLWRINKLTLTGNIRVMPTF